MIKIKIHSATDLITNSSTVIFTYSGSSEGALKTMIDEIFKTFGVNKTCDEVFDTVVLCESSEPYSEYFASLSEEGDTYPEGFGADTDVDQLYRDVEAGKTPKPQWFNDVEEKEDSWSYYTPSTYLCIIPKQEEYKKLGELINAFLYSTDHEATRDG
jgi:hypothetical protein